MTLAAVALALPAAALGQSAPDTANDHANGAQAIDNANHPLMIDRPGDSDWYAIAGFPNPDGRPTYTIIRGDVTCADGTPLRVTLLNPELRPMRWWLLQPSRAISFSAPDHDGRYYIAIDADGSPTCSGLDYALRVTAVLAQQTGTDTRSLICNGERGSLRAAQHKLSADRAGARRYHGAARARYERYVRADERTVASRKRAVSRDCRGVR